MTVNDGHSITLASPVGNTEKASLYGISTYGCRNSKITNNGSITITANSENAEAEAYGVSGAFSACSFNNSGTMTISAESTGSAATACGVRVTLKSETIENNGTIDVSATSKEAKAYGVYVAQAIQTFNNTGTINVSATGSDACAYQVFVAGGITTNIGTWTLKLGETYGKEAGKGYYVFGMGNGKLRFGLEEGKGAHFIISGKGDAFVSGAEYAIKDMVDVVDGKRTALGFVETVTSAYEFLEVELIDKGEVKDSYLDQYIKGSLTTSTEKSPTHGAASQTTSGMTANMNQLRTVVGNQTRTVGQGFVTQGMRSEGKSATATMYTDASTSVTDAGGSYVTTESSLWKTFLTPYYSQTGANNNDYDGHMYGITLGATRQVTDAFSVGAHFGLSKGVCDSALTDTDATSYVLGMHAVYNVGESLFFRGQLSGFMSENDLDMRSGSGAYALHADTDMDTAGVYAMVAAGYDIMLTPEHFLTPELGLSYFYSHMDGFDTDFYDINGAKDSAIGMKSESYDAWYADATLRWTGVFDAEKGVLKPTLKAGIRQALSDPEVSSTMKFAGMSSTTHSDANKTAFLCEVGLSWELDDITLSATYSGEFGDVEYSHMGMFKVEWAF